MIRSALKNFTTSALDDSFLTCVYPFGADFLFSHVFQCNMPFLEGIRRNSACGRNAQCITIVLFHLKSSALWLRLRFVILKTHPCLNLCASQKGISLKTWIFVTKWCENDLPSMLYMSVFYCTFTFAIMLPNVSVGFLLSVSIVAMETSQDSFECFLVSGNSSLHITKRCPCNIQ